MPAGRYAEVNVRLNTAGAGHIFINYPDGGVDVGTATQPLDNGGYLLNEGESAQVNNGTIYSLFVREYKKP